VSSNTKFLLCIVIFLVLCIFGVAAKNFVIFGITNNNHLIDKISDKVIERLQRDYSPSPYGPSVDPDKIDMEKFKKTK